MDKNILCYVPVVGWVILFLTIFVNRKSNVKYKNLSNRTLLFIVLIWFIGMALMCLLYYIKINEYVSLLVFLLFVSIAFIFITKYYMKAAEKVSREITKQINQGDETKYI